MPGAGLVAKLGAVVLRPYKECGDWGMGVFHIYLAFIFISAFMVINWLTHAYHRSDYSGDP
jgi:hypothetical protein